ncbi:MAG: DUF560 domain-containing protein [Gammaproteobacteria bacterium]|nr:MAG: DUF560 domain-containing protein [Gammaproteobacteria bacterium]
MAGDYDERAMRRVTSERARARTGDGGMNGMKRVGVRAAGVLAAGLLAATVVSAQQVDTINTLRDLVNQGQYQRAYELGQAAEERYEGRAEFDFHYGLAALETGNYPEAIFALERVVFARPDQLRVRLELARAHFLAGNYAAAEREFNRVLSADPPPSVRANVNRFMDRIQLAQASQRRQVRGWLDVRVGHDTNINSATSDSTISTPIGDFELVPTGQEISDEYARFEVGGQWREPLTKQSSLDARISYEHKENFSGSEFDLGIGRLDGGYTRNLEHGRVRVGARLQQVMLSNSRFQNSYGLVASYDRALAPGWIGSLTGAATALRYKGDSLRDTNQFLASAAVLRSRGAVTQSLSLYGAIEPSEEGGRGKHNGRDFVGAFYGAQFDAGRWGPYLRAGVQRAEYRDTHPVFARKRKDTTLTATVGTSLQVADAFHFHVETGYTDVDSNLPVFDYDRWLIEFGMRFGF